MAAPTAKPPLARPRTSSRPHAESREAAASDGPSKARALPKFISSVAAGIRGAVSAFTTLRQDELSFVSFKALWASHRLSVLFHVEFWDSTPTDVHRAVLQVAMDLLVQATEQLTAAPESREPFVSLVGHCFALYCAYRVQLSEPRLRIAVDLPAWRALSSAVEMLETARNATDMGDIALVALGVIRRLEHEDNAFLRCLGGCASEYRLEGRKTELRSSQIQSYLTPASLPKVMARKEDFVDDIIVQLEALSSQYNSSLQLLSNGINTITTAATASTEQKSKSRGREQSQLSFLRRSRPPQTRRENTLDPGLWTESRNEDSARWLSQLRRSFDRLVPNSSGPIVNPRARRSSLHLDVSSSDVDEALLALEQELEDVTEEDEISENRNIHDVSVESVPQSASSSQHVPKVMRTRSFSVASSAYESDGLDELEAELSRAVLEPKLAQKPATVTPNEYPQRQTRSLRPRGRSASLVSVNTQSDGLSELEAELAQNVAVPTSEPPQRQFSLAKKKSSPIQVAEGIVKSRSKPSPSIRTRQSTRASSFDSEDTELDFLQHELDAAIELNSAAESPHQRRRKNEVGMPYSVSKPSRPCNEPLAKSMGTRRSRRLSIASSGMESDAELLALQAELAAEPTIKAKSVPRRTEAPSTRKRSRAKSESSESDEELKLLEGELAANPVSASSATQSLRTKRATSKPKPKEKTPIQRRQTQRARKESSTVQVNTSDQPPKKTRRSANRSTQHDSAGVSTNLSTAVMPAHVGVTTRMSSRRSIASSYDSDGLAELEQELRAFS